VTTVLHMGWGYLFIIYLDMGVLGAAIALNITFCLNFAVQEFYIRFIDWSFFREYVTPLFQRSTLNWIGTKEFLKLAVPGTMMQCAEWWAFEVLAIFAGMLGKHQLAA
jgi:MATE family multidrug resistance protein